MAEAMTYTSLVDDVQSYAERNDSAFVSRIPRFIMMAENRLATTVRGLGMLQVATGVLVLEEATLPKPARWRETASFSILVDTVDPDNEALTYQNRYYLAPRTYEFCRAFIPTVTSSSDLNLLKGYLGQPRYYSDYGYEHFLLATTPDEPYAFELSYYERPQPLDETNQTSWTTRYAPQLLLYATLLEAQPWLQRPEQLTQFKALYEEAAGLVAAESTRRQVDHTIIRSPE